jgi:hypothetical protein
MFKAVGREADESAAAVMAVSRWARHRRVGHKAPHYIGGGLRTKNQGFLADALVEHALPAIKYVAN